MWGFELVTSSPRRKCEVIFLLDWCLEEPILWRAAQNPQLYMKDSTHISVSSFFCYWIRCTFRVMENGQPGCNLFVLNKGVAVFWAVGTQNTSEEKWGFCFCFSLVLLEHMHVCACVCVWVWVLYHNLMYLCGGSPSLFSALLSTMMESQEFPQEETKAV